MGSGSRNFNTALSETIFEHIAVRNYREVLNYNHMRHLKPVTFSDKTPKVA